MQLIVEKASVIRDIAGPASRADGVRGKLGIALAREILSPVLNLLK